MREELLRPIADPVEEAEEVTLRPRRLDEFVGQPRLKEHLEILLAAARGRGQAVDHLLFAGAPGLGKTTLSGIVAAEMGVSLRITSGPALERAGDLAAILTNLDDGDVLFIDEIHRLPRPVEEVLYPAMEDFELDIVIGKGPSARSIRLELPAVHARRCHHPHRAHHRAAARSLRLHRPPRLLRHRGSRRDPRACREHPRRAARARGRGGDRPALPRHAPHRQPAPEAGARLRRGPGRRHRERRHRPRRARRCSRSTSWASTRSTARSSPHSARPSPGSRWASPPWRWRWRRSRRRSRRSTSRSS